VANLRRHLERFGDAVDLSPDDLSYICVCSRDSVVRAMAEGRLEFFARGRLRRVTPASARKFAEEMERARGRLRSREAA
jgi:hypothetical protein